MARKPVGLIILDGWGLREQTQGNAIALARKPCFDRLWQTYPHCSVGTSGEDVGLPKGQMGNSEVGHMNIGAGRVVLQDLLRIHQSIASGEFFQNAMLVREFKRIAQSPRSTLHLVGLVSAGGIHSHLDHMLACVRLAKDLGIRHCFLHAFTDGRDTPPKIALQDMEKVEASLRELQYGRIATVCGRFFAMDRDQRWDRLEKAYRTLVLGDGKQCPSAKEAVSSAYAAGETDEFITPSVIVKEGKPLAQIQSGEGVFFINFRPDRCREIVSALTLENFSHFKRPLAMEFVSFSTMTSYHEDYSFPIAFQPLDLSYSLGEVLGREGLPQLRIAETEKFPHVTFFFSAGRDEPFAKEERILIPSPRDVKTYDLKPEMSALKVTEALLEALQKKHFSFFLLNLANPDMVGHTGVLAAGIKAVETVDHCLDRVLKEVVRQGGLAIVTADHGNCEQMLNDDGTAHTSHTTNRVPLILVDEKRKNISLRQNGILADIAPTLLHLLELEKTESFQKARALMNGRNLLAS